MSMSLGWSLVAVPFLIAMNAFFVAAEYALVAVRGYQVDALKAKGKRKTAAALTSLKESPASSIGAIQVCITMTNLLLGWIGEPAMTAVLLRLFKPLEHLAPDVIAVVSTVLSFIVVTLLTVVLSELLPKALTLRFVEPVATFTAVPMLGIKNFIRPLVWVMNTLADAVTRVMGLGRVTEMEEQSTTAEEITMIARQAASDGVLTEQERSLILNALALGHRTARHVMVPRFQVAYLDLKRSMDENRRVMNERLFSRMPLCDGGMDKVVGVVPVKEFMAAYYGHGDSSVLSLIARQAEFVPDTMPTDKLANTLLRAESKMVVVVDEYGGVDGIVTLNDLVDDLFGVTAADRRGGTVPPANAGEPKVPVVPHVLVVPGDTLIHEAAAQLGRDGWGEGMAAVTVGGLVVDRLRRFPTAGEVLDVDGVSVRVLESDDRAVRKVELTPPPPPAEEAGDGKAA